MNLLFIIKKTICECVAEKMRSSQKVLDLVLDSIMRGKYSSNTWVDWTLSEGMTGIAIFYGAMDLVYPDQGWISVADNYLESVIKSLKKREHIDCSLFRGLSGVALAIHFVSQKREKYNIIKNKIDDFLAQELYRLFLQRNHNFLFPQVPVPPNFYNLTQGLSGIILYFLHQKDNYLLRY